MQKALKSNHLDKLFSKEKLLVVVGLRATSDYNKYHNLALSYHFTVFNHLFVIVKMYSIDYIRNSLIK